MPDLSINLNLIQTVCGPVAPYTLSQRLTMFKFQISSGGLNLKGLAVAGF